MLQFRTFVHVAHPLDYEFLPFEISTWIRIPR